MSNIHNDVMRDAMTNNERINEDELTKRIHLLINGKFLKLIRLFQKYLLY